MYRTILFDLDGTLTDSRPGIVNCVRYAMEHLALPALDDAILTKFIGPPLADSFRHYCGLSSEAAKQAVGIFRERYSTLGLFENAAVPGMPELLRELREMGYTLALASSKPRVLCEPIAKKFGYFDSLHALVGSGEGVAEDKAAVIAETLRQLRNPPLAELLMVGDRSYDVLGAAKCGIACAGVEFCGYADPMELQLAGAVCVVQSPQELKNFIVQSV